MIWVIANEVVSAMGHVLARERDKTSIAAEVSGAERHRRRLVEVADLESMEAP
jgi:hypothetical protein